MRAAHSGLRAACSSERAAFLRFGGGVGAALQQRWDGVAAALGRSESGVGAA